MMASSLARVPSFVFAVRPIRPYTRTVDVAQRWSSGGDPAGCRFESCHLTHSRLAHSDGSFSFIVEAPMTTTPTTTLTEAQRGPAERLLDVILGSAAHLWHNRPGLD